MKALIQQRQLLANLTVSSFRSLCFNRQGLPFLPVGFFFINFTFNLGPGVITRRYIFVFFRRAKASVVSLAAVFWMLRNAPSVLLGERCVSSKKRLQGRLRQVRRGRGTSFPVAHVWRSSLASRLPSLA